MNSQPAFQTRGLWPSVPHFESHIAPTLEPPVASYLTPLARFTGQLIRPLTPPADHMGSVAYQFRPMGSKYQEQETYNADRDPVRPYGFSHDSVTDRLVEQGPTQHYSRSQAPISRQASPVPSHTSFTSNSSQQQRKASHVGLIAPSLQIPATINNSQGSLSELAAQVTCLFWFESSAVLDFAEDPAAVVLPIPSLKRETTPSSGFRKWVTTIISHTQVAQNVILLALLFIYRLKRQNPTVQGKEGSEYRLLTVALMLGNKFLDDNTYTNKTWADVSGISVAEVHIMEVEFLSNMKYNLFTSAEQWNGWQAQLAKFARFLERASQPPALPIPQQTAYGQISLPSPPTSFQASPPRASTPVAPSHYYQSYPQHSHLHPMDPHPLAPILTSNPRKRSFEDEEVNHAAKRVTYGRSFHHQQPPHQQSGPSSQPYDPVVPAHQHRSSQSATPMETQQMSSAHTPQDVSIMNRLPPLTLHLRTSVGGPASSWQNTPVSMGPVPGALAAALQTAHASKHQSSYPPSTNVSPTNTSMIPSNNQSPSVFLAQRDSPYKPVRGVQTLLVPPPSRAMHQHERVGNNQMHYQPLGRPQERQSGRLPYISQNQWYEGSQQQVGTPINQWQAPMSTQQQNYQRPQLPQHLR